MWGPSQVSPWDLLPWGCHSLCPVWEHWCILVLLVHTGATGALGLLGPSLWPRRGGDQGRVWVLMAGGWPHAGGVRESAGHPPWSSPPPLPWHRGVIHAS